MDVIVLLWKSFGGGSLVAMAGVVLGIIALTRLSRLEQELARLRAQIAALRSPQAPADPIASRTLQPPADPISALRERLVQVSRPTPTADVARIDDAPGVRSAPEPPSVPIAPASHAPAPAIAPAAPAPYQFGEALRRPQEFSPVSPVVTPFDPVPASATSAPREAPARTPTPIPPLAKHDAPVAQGQSPTTKPKPSSPSRDLESEVGKRWLTWAGIALLFLGAVFLLKYAYDQDWLGRIIGPRTRVVGIALVGAAALAWGLRLQRQGMTAIGDGVAGGAIALLYLSVYGAFSPALLLVPEPLLPGKAAFVLMAAVTALGMGLAGRRDALAMAVCALVGGFATPLLVNTGGGSRDGLFTYILLLDLGVLGVALYRRWRALDLLAFAGTVAIYLGWWHQREPHDVGIAWAMLLWLAVFHAVFLVLPFAHHWRMRSPVTIERFCLALGNLAFALAFAAHLLRADEPRLLAVICLILAGVYALVGVVTRRRVGDDPKVVHGFLALGAMLLTLGLFYLLPVDAVATAWAAESVALLWLGYRFAHPPTRAIAHGVLAIAALRIVVVHLPLGDPAAALVFNAWLPGLLVVPLGAAALATVHRIDESAGDRVQRWSWWSAALATLLCGTAELHRHAQGHPAAWVLWPNLSAIAAWWALGGLTLLACARRWISPPTAVLSVLPILVGAALAMQTYTVAWCGGPPAANPRFLSAFACLAAGWLWMLIGRRELAADDLRPVRSTVRALVVIGALLLATLETVSWHAGDRASSDHAALHRALTLVWSLSAIGAAILAATVRSRAIAVIALMMQVLAVLTAAGLFVRDFDRQVPFANARFLLAALAVAGFAVQALAWSSVDLRRRIHHCVQILATLFISAELCWWAADHIDRPQRISHAVVAVAWTWGLSALVAFWRADRARGVGGVVLGTLAALSAGLLALLAYAWAWYAVLPVFNARCLAAVVTLAALVYAFRLARSGRLATASASASAAFAWLAVGFGFVLCTVESYHFFLEAAADPVSGARVATFAVTVTWLGLAATGLAIGFRIGNRTTRLLALALFALTAAKLLVVDMRGVQQLYRILAFLLTGAVLVAASYAYHRLERRVSEADRRD